MQQQGRAYSFYHGRPTSNGVLFWRFVEYPDKERIEVTQERDVAYIYTGDKGYELTFKGPHAMEKKDLDDYLAAPQIVSGNCSAHLGQRSHRGAFL